MKLSFRNAALLLQHWLSGFDSKITCEPFQVLPNELQPVFLIGSPRTGSTFFFQVMVKQLHLAYISNAMALMPRFMIRLCTTFPSLANDYQGLLQPGELGYISGLSAPNEAGSIMRDWFDAEQTPYHEKMVHNTVSAITNIINAPLFLKNQSNTLRYETVNKIFPHARFIHLRRSILYTAQSIILARRKLFGDEKQWWSVKPPGYELVLKEEPFFQVLWQVHKLNKMANDICSAQPDFSFRVDYEIFCTDPAVVFDKLRIHFGLRHRETQPYIINQLKQSCVQRLPKKDWNRLVRIFETYFADQDGNPV